jgi:hypothetical protein
MTDFLWLLFSIALVIGLLWLARRIEPHWSAKDGSSFTCRVQNLDVDGRGASRWTEARAFVEGDRLSIKRKVLVRFEDDGPPREVIGRTPSAPAGKAMFVLGGEPLLALRVPKKSPATPQLESMAREPLL